MKEEDEAADHPRKRRAMLACMCFRLTLGKPGTCEAIPIGMPSKVLGFPKGGISCALCLRERRRLDACPEMPKFVVPLDMSGAAVVTPLMQGALVKSKREA
eukprot:8994821-Alexandrium_andersonii.AAC.1